MKVWIDAFLLATLFMVLALTGCVSNRTYRLDKEAAYHSGRQSVIWRVSGWLNEDSLDKDELKNLIQGMKSGEFIWSSYYMGLYFPQKTQPKIEEWEMPPLSLEQDTKTKGERLP